MKYKLIHSAFILSLLCSDCSLQKKAAAGNNDLPASSLIPFGRYAWNEKKDLELISSAINFGFSFSGTECKVFAYLDDTTAHNYLQYELDGVYQKRIRIVGNERRPLVITASREGTHTVWIYKATEAHTGPIFIEKIVGQDLKPLKKARSALDRIYRQ